MTKTWFLAGIISLMVLSMGAGLFLFGCGNEEASAKITSPLIGPSEIPEYAIIIDARSDSDCDNNGVPKYSEGHLKDAINIPWSDFREEFSKLKPVADVADMLGDKGITEYDTIAIYGYRGDGYIYWVFKALEHIGEVYLVENWVDSADDIVENTLDGTEYYPVASEYAYFTDTQGVYEKYIVGDEKWKVIAAVGGTEFSPTPTIENSLPVAPENKNNDFRIGHIPDAIQINYNDLFVDGNWQIHDFKDATALKHLFKKKGLKKEDTIVSYCHSGRRIGYMFFALDLCEYENIMNYEESFKIYNRIAMYLPVDNSYTDMNYLSDENNVPGYLQDYFDIQAPAETVVVPMVYRTLEEEQIED